MSRTRDEAQVTEAHRLYGLGLTTYAIAAHLRVDPRTVQRWLADVTGPRGPRPRADVRDSLILDLRDREALSFAAIGRRVHMSPTGARMRYYALTGRERPERTRETAAPVGLPPGPSAALLSLLTTPDWRLSFMLLAAAFLAALLVVAVVLRLFAEDGPDNGEPPDAASGDQDQDVPLAA